MSSRQGTLALSWGPWGGVYVYRGYCKRICLGWAALTYCPNVEFDDLMEAYVDDHAVRAETYPGAASDIGAEVQDRGGWVCEQHPDRPFPHDDCAGPGMPALPPIRR